MGGFSDRDPPDQGPLQLLRRTRRPDRRLLARRLLRIVDYEDAVSLATVFPKWLSRAQKDCLGAARYISLTGWYRAGILLF